MQEPSRKPVKFEKVKNAASAGWLRHFSVQ